MHLGYSWGIIIHIIAHIVVVDAVNIAISIIHMSIVNIVVAIGVYGVGGVDVFSVVAADGVGGMPDLHLVHLVEGQLCCSRVVLLR